MGLNVGEASAVNTLLDYLTDNARLTGVPVEKEDAYDALELLAAGANRRLMAGWDGKRVRAWVNDEEPVVGF